MNSLALNLMNDNDLPPIELSLQKGLELEKEVQTIEYHNSSRRSSDSSARTVKLRADQYKNPSISFSVLNSSREIRSQSIRLSSRLNSIYSIVMNPQSKTLNLEMKEIKKGKILIVDDNYYNNEATKNILKKVLKESGSEMEIIIGSEGADIIYYIIQDQSKGNEIKGIITDENMEYINGSEAIRIIRNLEKSNKIKFVNIISVTGNDESQYTNEIIKAGAQLVLSKPLSKSIIAI